MNTEVAIVLTYCVCTAPRNTMIAHVFPHLKMVLFVKPSAVGQLKEMEFSGNQSFNGTNLTIPVVEPCIICLVEAPFYLVVLIFILTILALVAAAKALPLVIRFVVANILIANFTAGLGYLVPLLTSIVTRVRRSSLTDGECRFIFVLISVASSDL